MKRKYYMKPAMRVVKLRHQTNLLQASQQSESTSVQNYDWNEYSEE